MCDVISSWEGNACSTAYRKMTRWSRLLEPHVFSVKPWLWACQLWFISVRGLNIWFQIPWSSCCLQVTTRSLRNSSNELNDLRFLKETLFLFSILFSFFDPSARDIDCEHLSTSISVTVIVTLYFVVMAAKWQEPPYLTECLCDTGSSIYFFIGQCFQRTVCSALRNTENWFCTVNVRGT